MDRNLILAVALSVLTIVAFQYYYKTVAPPPAKKPPATTEKIRPSEVKEREAVKEKRELGPSVSKRAPEEEKPAPLTTAEEEKARPATQVKVESPKYVAVLSSTGARIVSFKLKDYTQTLGGESLVDLFDPGGPDTSGPSLILVRRDETLTDSGLNYALESGETSVVLSGKTEKRSITFRTMTKTGLGIAKTYTFYPDRYSIDFSVTLTNASSEDRDYLVTFPWRKFYHEDKSNRFVWNSAEILLNGELKDYTIKDIRGDEEPSGRVEWAGLGDVYFFNALVFGEHPAKKVTLFKPSADGVGELKARYGALEIPAGKSVPLDLSLYLGPKERSALRDAGHNLSKALVYSNYAVLEIMSEYLMKFLRLLNGGFQVAGIRVPGTGNWGIDIIILTIVIKILFVPLTHKSMKSMKRMQDVQPQIAKLREKYKDDKVALNKATMELFREHKVNPLGGCWPMFLQLPVFIGLYQSLSYAIELRHAGFVCFPSIYFCINDLSAPDPYYVTPIIMGGTMVLQQWMTPSGGDPTQKKMMLIMPVVFTYLFLSFPSGLVLYWLVSNLLSIGQQLITNRMAE